MKRFGTLLLAAALCLAALWGCSGPSAAPASAATAPQTSPPAATVASTPTEQPAATPATATPEPSSTGVLPEEDYAYFLRVGFSLTQDWGRVVAKWASPLRIQVLGKPGAGDGAALSTLVQGLRGVDGMPDVEFVTEGGNVRIGLLQKKDGKKFNAGYNGTDPAQLFMTRNGDAITSLDILITDGLADQDTRNAALASLLFRGLGLEQDSQGQYADSVLNPAMTAPQPSRLDWLMLSLLYCPGVKPGMLTQQALTAVRGLKPTDPAPVKTANANSFNKDELLDYFNEVGFYYKDESTTSGVANKWASPIKLQLSGNPSAEQKQMLDEYIIKLNEIQGFPGVSLVNAGGNFTVAFETRAQVKKSFPKMAAAEACALKVTRARGGAITGCSVGVDAEFKDVAQSRSQFLRAFIWGLGLNFTSETWKGSMLSLDSNARDWANLDWKMLELLYRPDVKAGASRAAAMALLEKAIK